MTLSPQTIALLQEQVRRTGRSLLQYVSEAYPWTSTAKDTQIVACLNQMQQAEQRAMTRLGRFLLQQRANPPLLGSYPMHFTTLNFLAVDRLLILLAEQQASDVADMQAALARIAEPAARARLQELLTLRERHLQTLQELANQSQPALAGA